MLSEIQKDEKAPSSMLEHLEQEERWASSRRWRRLTAAAVIALAAVMAVAAWYAYPVLRTQGLLNARFLGLQPVVDTMSTHIKNADARLADLSKNHDELKTQMDKLGREMRSRLEAAKKQTSDATAAIMSRVESEIDSRTNGLQARLANLESSRASDQERIAQMQQEMERVRADVAQQSEELAAARRDMNSSKTSTDQHIADLEQGERRDRSDVDQITNNLAVESVRFEASKGRLQELTPGISLKLTGTDVSTRRVSGWMWVMPERRTIWLRGQGVQQPVIFYGLEDGKKRELVITQVNKDSVLGYVILPKATQANSNAGD